MKTRDIDIRSQLHDNLNQLYKSDNDTRIVDELGLCQGDARIDVAVINGILHGYEIKSESDTLERLPNQVEIYSKVLDTITIITGKNHLEKVFKIVPEWWGIELVEKDNQLLCFHTVRSAQNNNFVDAYSIAQLLWKEEALDILRRFELAEGVLSKPRKKVWGKLADSFPLNDLKYYVREKLKYRSNWRSDQPQMLNDD